MDFYLPHYAVFREDKQTTKTKIVFDGSAKDSAGVSLNTCIQGGPALQPDLVGILLRFRRNQVAITGDIEKMFLQIVLKDTDRDSHHYLWRDLDLEATPKVYRMTRVTFGIISSPFMAICTKREHARLHLDAFPNSSAEILRNTYVDDLVTGTVEVHEAIQLQQRSKELMKLGGFNLTMWSSNSPEVIRAIPEEDRAAKSLVNLENDSQKVNLTKALGLHWNPNEDTLVFKLELGGFSTSSGRNAEMSSHTKREVLSRAAKVYDPLGFITPFTVQAKILFQSLWTHGLNWDEDIPPDVSKRWDMWFQDSAELKDLHIPRCYVTQPLSSHSKLELHAFGDASKLAYAMAVYLRAVAADGETSTSLIMSKSRVAPLKTLTLPRLELMAAVITVRLCTYVRSMLHCPITSIVCWTDNASTLHWVRGAPQQ